MYQWKVYVIVSLKINIYSFIDILSLEKIVTWRVHIKLTYNQTILMGPRDHFPRDQEPMKRLPLYASPVSWFFRKHHHRIRVQPLEILSFSHLFPYKMYV